MWCYDDRVEWNGLVFVFSGGSRVPEFVIDAPEGEYEDANPTTDEEKDEEKDERGREAERVAMQIRYALPGQVRPEISVVRAPWCPAKLLSDASVSRWREAIAWAMARKVSSRRRKEPERLYDVLRLQGPLPGRPEGFPGGDNSKWAAKVDD